MSALKIVAILLIVADIVGLAYGGFTYTKDSHVAKIGSLELSVTDKKSVTSRSGPASARSWSGEPCCSSEGTSTPKVLSVHARVFPGHAARVSRVGHRGA